METKKELPFEARQSIDYITRLVNGYEIQIKDLKTKLDSATNIKTPQPLLTYKFYSEQLRELREYRSSDMSKCKKPSFTKEQVEAFQKEDVEIFNKNEAISKSNCDSLELAILMFEKLGLKRKRSEYKSSRSRQKVDVKNNWVIDVENIFPTSCGYDWSTVERGYSEYFKFLKDYEKYEQGLKLKAEQDEQQKQAKKKFDLFLASIILKYKLDEVSDVYSCMEAILSKDKYLRLAHYLARNRGDWSDGCDYAEMGLNGFTIETDTDRKIYDCIYEYISNWGDHGDGRVFRDCEWNYDVIYGIVQEKNPELYADYQKLEELKLSTRYDCY